MKNTGRQQMPPMPDHNKKKEQEADYSSLKESCAEADYSGFAQTGRTNSYTYSQPDLSAKTRTAADQSASDNTLYGRIGRINPFKILAILGLGAVFTTVGGVIFADHYGAYSEPVGTAVAEESGPYMSREDAQDAWDFSEYSDMISLEPVSVYVNSSNRPVVTYKIAKEDLIQDLSMSTANLYYGDTLVESYVMLPKMGAGTPEAYVSVAADIHYLPEEADQIDLSEFSLIPDPDQTVMTPISEYVYSESEMPDDPDTLIRLYKAQYPYEFHNVEVLSESGEGKKTVTYRVSTKSAEDNAGDVLYQPMQILFSKDGNVVYAEEFYPDDSFDTYEQYPVTGTFTTTWNVPEYDEVTIRELS